MSITRSKSSSVGAFGIVLLATALFGATACEGDDGDQGPPGPPGDPGTDSLAAAIGYRGIFTLRPARSVAAQDSVDHDPRDTLGRFPVTARTTFPEFRRLVASRG